MTKSVFFQYDRYAYPSAYELKSTNLSNDIILKELAVQKISPGKHHLPTIQMDHVVKINLKGPIPQV